MSSMTLDQTHVQTHVRPSATLRLTRRGRLTVFLLSLVVVLALGVWIAAGSVATERPAVTETITVGTGQTLWDIAADVADDGEVRAMVAEIEDLNELSSAGLTAGQRLRVPAGH